MDANQASKIISDVEGEKSGGSVVTGAKDPKASDKVLSLSLEAGMMTRDTSGSDHDDSANSADSHAKSSNSGSEEHSPRSESEEEDSPFRNTDFSKAVDDWLKGPSSESSPSKKPALVQKTPGLGLR